MPGLISSLPWVAESGKCVATCAGQEKLHVSRFFVCICCSQPNRRSNRQVPTRDLNSQLKLLPSSTSPHSSHTALYRLLWWWLDVPGSPPPPRVHLPCSLFPTTSAALSPFILCFFFYEYPKQHCLSKKFLTYFRHILLSQYFLFKNYRISHINTFLQTVGRQVLGQSGKENKTTSQQVGLSGGGTDGEGSITRGARGSRTMIRWRSVQDGSLGQTTS